MTKYASTVAVIPARGGSKRVPRKNVYPILGRPILAWVIEKCFSSQAFDRVVVSSEDDEILELARRWGAEPHRRPRDLSDDFTHVGPVVDECLDSLSVKPKVACLIYPTSILITAQDLQLSKRVALAPDVRSVLSIAEFESPIQRAYELNDRMEIKLLQPECLLSRTQDLEKRYRDSGGFYWFKTDGTGKADLGYLLPKSRSFDIDTPDDMEIAVALFFHFKKSGVYEC